MMWGLVSLTPTHPPPSIIQRTQAVGGKDLPHWVVSTQFGWFAPQTLHQERRQLTFMFTATRGVVSVIDEAPTLTVTFCRHSAQLVLDLWAQEAKTQMRSHFFILQSCNPKRGSNILEVVWTLVSFPGRLWQIICCSEVKLHSKVWVTHFPKRHKTGSLLFTADSREGRKKSP